MKKQEMKNKVRRQIMSFMIFTIGIFMLAAGCLFFYELSLGTLKGKLILVYAFMTGFLFTLSYGVFRTFVEEIIKDMKKED